MKKYMGLIIALTVIMLSIIILSGTGRFLGSFIGFSIGIITTVVSRGFAENKRATSIIAATFLTIMCMAILFYLTTFGYFALIRVSDFFAMEHKLDLQLHGSYEIDREVRKRLNAEGNETFTHFIQLGRPKYNTESIDAIYKEQVFRSYGLTLPDEMMNDFTSSEKNIYALIAFGRELKEVRYQYLGRFSDGVTSKARITFYEEYQDDIIYVYFMRKKVHFWSIDYYVMEGTQENYIELYRQ